MLLSPSLFNSDLYLIKDTLSTLQSCGISEVHIDIMDNHYVPNLGFNSEFIASLKKHTHFKVDCHLMIEKPELSIMDFIAVKPDILTFHFESTVHHAFVIDKIISYGIKVGIAINPSTPVAALKLLLPIVDSVLVMSVNPGQKGERFLPFTLVKMAQLQSEKIKHNYHYDIQVDGNITDANLSDCLQAGATNIVSGGFIFKNNDIQNNIAKLTAIMAQG